MCSIPVPASAMSKMRLTTRAASSSGSRVGRFLEPVSEVGWPLNFADVTPSLENRQMPLRPMGRERIWMLPPTLDELIPADHPARFVDVYLDGLDREGWAELGVDTDGDPMGAPAYLPRALLSVWLYGFMTGVRSTRKLEAACRDQIPYLWLTGSQRPDHNTLWRFYKNHRQAMRNLFRHTVRTAFTMELLDLAVQAVDGTKVRANAANDRTYDDEALRRLSKRLKRTICDLEAQNEAGEDAAPANLPQELAHKEALRERMRQAKETLANSDRLKQINLTDQDAIMMRTRQGITLAYNSQATVSPAVTDGKVTGMLITAADVVNDPVDQSQLGPMLEKAEETSGVRAETTLADAGYHSGSNLEECARKGQRVVMPEAQDRALENPYHKDRFAYDEASDSYRCPEGRLLRFTRIKRTHQTVMRLYRASGAVCRACPAFGVCTTDKRHGRALEIGPHDAALRRHRAWMSTEEAKRAYKQRKQLVEPVFGILKEQQQARRFLLRGLANVAAEWTLLATAFNLRTLWRIWRAQAPDPEFTNVSQRRIGALPRDTDRVQLKNGLKLPACVLRAIVPAAVPSIFQRIRLAPLRLALSPTHF